MQIAQVTRSAIGHCESQWWQLEEVGARRLFMYGLNLIFALGEADGKQPSTLLGRTICTTFRHLWNHGGGSPGGGNAAPGPAAITHRNVLDDYNREGLGIEVDFSLPAARVIRALDQIIEWRGKPKTIRSDNGPEYISAEFEAWAEKRGIRLLFIQPGKPQQNAYVERFNRTVRHEWLDEHIFRSIDHAQETATQWLWRYNAERPNMALGGITPYQKLAMAA